jgi:hypothetical protein
MENEVYGNPDLIGTKTMVTTLVAFSPLLLMVAPTLIKHGPSFIGNAVGANAPDKMTLAFHEWYKTANKGQFFTANIQLGLALMPKFLSLLREQVWGKSGPNYWPDSEKMAQVIAKQMGGQPPAPVIKQAIVKMKSFMLMEGLENTSAVEFSEWLHGKRTGIEKIALAGKVTLAGAVLYFAYKHRATLRRVVGK